MYKLGKSPPRALGSFGVAGLLEEGCKVYYDSLFSTRHVGRVSDLIAARLKETGMDELRLRALLLYGVFQAFRGQVENEGALTSEGSLSEPLVVEVGVDSEKLAVGVSFTLPEGGLLALQGLQERINSSNELNNVERMLKAISDHTDCLVLRHQPASRRYEAVGLLGLTPEVSGSGSREAIEIVELEADLPYTPEPGSYTELGDLDYPELLKEDGFVPRPAVNVGEILAKRIAPDHLNPDPKTIVSGKTEETPNELVTISGSHHAHQDETLIRVQGSGEIAHRSDIQWNNKTNSESASGLLERELQTLQAQISASPDKTQTAESQARMYQEWISQLQRKIGSLEKQIDSQVRVVKGGENSSSEVLNQERITVSGAQQVDPEKNDGPETAVASPQNEVMPQEPHATEEKLHFVPEIVDSTEEVSLETAGTQDSEVELKDSLEIPSEITTETDVGIFSKLKKLWPFGRKRSEGEQSEEISDAQTEPQPILSQAAEVDQESEPKGKEEVVVDAREAVQSLAREIEAGQLQRTIVRFQKDLNVIKKDIRSESGKKWMDELLQELIADKARLQTTTRKLNKSILQRDFEYRTKEQSIREEIRRQEEQIKAKESQLMQAKEQIGQLKAGLERAQEAAQGASKEASFKNKFNHVSKLLSAAQENNSALTKKIEELRAAASAVKFQPNPQKDAEYKELQGRFEKVNRKTEEFKHEIKHLKEKIVQLEKDKKRATKVDEIKTKLDDAMKLAVEKRNEAETLKAKLGELEHEKIRLTRELNQARSALKTATESSGSGGPDESGQAPAA